jgi:hypothetical protein
MVLIENSQRRQREGSWQLALFAGRSAVPHHRSGLLISPLAVGRYGWQPAGRRLTLRIGFPQQPSSLRGPPAAGPALQPL